MPGSTNPISSHPVFAKIQGLKERFEKKQIKHSDVREFYEFINKKTSNEEKMKHCLKPLNEFLGKNKAVIESASAAIPSFFNDLNRALDQSLELFIKENEKQATQVVRKGSAQI